MRSSYSDEKLLESHKENFRKKNELFKVISKSCNSIYLEKLSGNPIIYQEKNNRTAPLFIKEKSGQKIEVGYACNLARKFEGYTIIKLQNRKPDDSIATFSPPLIPSTPFATLESASPKEIAPLPIYKDLMADINDFKMVTSSQEVPCLGSPRDLSLRQIVEDIVKKIPLSSSAKDPMASITDFKAMTSSQEIPDTTFDTNVLAGAILGQKVKSRLEQASKLDQNTDYLKIYALVREAAVLGGKLKNITEFLTIDVISSIKETTGYDFLTTLINTNDYFIKLHQQQLRLFSPIIVSTAPSSFYNQQAKRKILSPAPVFEQPSKNQSTL